MPRTKSSEQDTDTKVADGQVPQVPGEISPAADQSNRDSEIAARMAMTPVRTLGQQQAVKKSAPEFTVDENGERVYVDPDEFGPDPTIEKFPTDVCVNCRNHDRESKLNKNGFCVKCGFKLNRVNNTALEPAQK